ncbi:NAD(P)-binding protein [Apiospora saccharicola]|uniref:NAD(P)-binding protein n=1 Tax=Apiospora saccharicola TaxID=335842 RepID=A0ABR1UL54_9PEZI
MWPKQDGRLHGYRRSYRTRSSCRRRQTYTDLEIKGKASWKRTFSIPWLIAPQDKLEKLIQTLSDEHPDFQGSFYATDVSDHKAVEESVSRAVKEAGRIDILINNAGLALGAPARFPELSISDIVTMNNVNVNGYTRS